MDVDSNPTGIPNEKISNDLKYVNGLIETLTKNIIAENLLAHLCHCVCMQFLKYLVQHCSLLPYISPYASLPINKNGLTSSQL